MTWLRTYLCRTVPSFLNTGIGTLYVIMLQKSHVTSKTGPEVLRRCNAIEQRHRDPHPYPKVEQVPTCNAIAIKLLCPKPCSVVTDLKSGLPSMLQFTTEGNHNGNMRRIALGTTPAALSYDYVGIEVAAALLRAVAVLKY